MKFFHLSDLHFGKQLQGYDLAGEQREFIRQLVQLVKKEKPDAVVVAGDIYDRSVPSAAAMTLLEEFFVQVGEAQQEKPTELLLIAGNHDSAERLHYGSRFLQKHHIHIVVLPPMQEGERMEQVILNDSWGEVHFYLLPFIKPEMFRNREDAGNLQSSDQAVRFLLDKEQIDPDKRNVLVAHQFFRAKGKTAKRCDSEMPGLAVGGLDEVDTTSVENFDYVALGHIHSPQDMGERRIRYCGTPYPYSVSEAGQQKSVTVVEMKEKGNISVRCLPVLAKRAVRDLRGGLEEITDQAGNGICSDYVRITLTDDDLPEQPKEYLENYFDHILEVNVDNRRTRAVMEEELPDIQETAPEEAFRVFFREAAGREMNQEEEAVFCEILKEVGVS